MELALKKTNAIISFILSGTAAFAMTVDTLRCEYLTNPLGVETLRPRLSWMLHSDVREEKQSGYQILVASSQAILDTDKGDLWDTEKVASNESVNIEYVGKPLVSRMDCLWKVRVWDHKDQPSAWSPASRWSMGLLQPSDWKAGWISFLDDRKLAISAQQEEVQPARHYRKQFNGSKHVSRAMLYASALGIYDFKINGTAVSDHIFTPGWSDYIRRAYYNTYDVTALIAQGANVLAATVADGWYSGYLGYGLLVGYGPNKCGRYIYGTTPAVIAQLELTYDDGSSEMILSDESWRTTTGPVIGTDMLMGESYDARLELGPWERAGFDDSTWAHAVAAEKNVGRRAVFHDKNGEREVNLGFVKPPKMQAYSGVPVRITEELKPVKLTEHQPGVWIFDMGQNFSGVVRLKVRGDAGTKVTLRHGEMLHPDGRLMTENLRRARATDTYILRGGGDYESWTPQFTYHGFQFVELTGLKERPSLETLTGIVMHSDTPMTSEFQCSDPMVNKLFQNITWTQRANFFELPTDCPQRNERFGWTGDAQIYVRTATFNADVAAFFTKWLDDLEEAQLPNGAYPDYAPYPMMHGNPKQGFGTAWMDAGIICPFTIYLAYGDLRVIRRHYTSMQRFIQFRQKNSPDFLGVNVGNTWGDWLSIKEQTPIDYIDTVYFAQSVHLMSRMAAAIGENADAAEYAALFEKIKAAFHGKYVNADGTLKVETQTAYALALKVPLVAESQLAACAAKLASMIRANDGCMRTGFLGTQPLLLALTKYGQNDLAVQLLQNRKFPSWGFEVDNGATSIWERWNSYSKEDGFASVSMNSFSHYSFGAVCEWMFRYLAGIDTVGAGYREIVIAPRPPFVNPDHEPINQVRATYTSVRGVISSEWQRKGQRFELTVIVPPNVTATVKVPALAGQKVTVDGKSVADVPYVTAAGRTQQSADFQVGSGTYHFVAE